MDFQQHIQENSNFTEIPSKNLIFLTTDFRKQISDSGKFSGH